ncbi:hypothetical protein KUCAC02_009720 [Chaenocephalus aceratus]|uniref:Uncharacterized protein n=1 Tax=Chaenocephalus aceratus TaxID=36190 RepID=A0ACB9VXP0_CHAAC|nr:hypothetical protein KUCAC02_009720 [Chaenocephalus aceratus]
MAAWLCRALVQRNGRLLLPYPNSVGRLCSRGVGSSSPAPGALSAFQDKPRTVEDLPNISFFELIYRMVFQGFYNRLHELQTPKMAVAGRSAVHTDKLKHFGYGKHALMQTFVLTAGQHQQHNLKRNNEVRDKRQGNCCIIITLYLLLSGDVHQCPGPTTRNINREVTKSNNPVSQVHDTHRESNVIEHIHQPGVMPCVCCPGAGDGLVGLCLLGSGAAGAGERRSGTPGAVAVDEGSSGDRDRLAAFGHSVEDAPMAMEEVQTQRVTTRLVIYNKQQYGPIYREGKKSVSVNTPQLLEEVLRNEEKFPTRGDLSAWKEYRDMRGYGYGPFTEEGERWYNLRVMLNKRMLHPKESAQYGDNINDVVTDFIKRLSYLRQCSPEEDLVPDMANEFYRFSLEGIASILLRQGLGVWKRKSLQGLKTLSTP